MVNEIVKTLDQLTGLLQQISDKQYIKPCNSLSNATIGGHTRHIIELLQCLENQYATGIVNYDLRLRDKKLHSDPNFAIASIKILQRDLNKEDKKLLLQQSFNDIVFSIETNYYRELLYNLEHCIHHQALIKVALLEIPSIIIHEDFGVAESTLAHRKQCAQ